MITISSATSAWLKPLVRKTVPYPARQWIRGRQERFSRRKQDLYERVIIREQRFTNLEGIQNFDFTLSPNGKRLGVSVLLRVKNEEQKIYHCLASIYDIFDEIVFVDNGSDDNTLTIVQQFKQRNDTQDKIKSYVFPFKQARFGPEHCDTPEDSVHSFTYYSNWSLSRCSFNYVCKWDGDMVLAKKRREAFRRFLKQIQIGRKMCWIVYGQTVYRDSANNHFLARGEINGEVRIFPNGFNPRFYKAGIYEWVNSEPPLEESQFDGVLFYELKFVNTDEFSHWSIRDIPTERKRRELENFNLIKSGEISNPRFEALPAGFLDDQIG
jgi:glycosyltransferase involved in cell wall biosynthesis